MEATIKINGLKIKVRVVEGDEIITEKHLLAFHVDHLPIDEIYRNLNGLKWRPPQKSIIGQSTKDFPDRLFVKVISKFY